MDGQHYVNYLQEKVSVTDIRFFFFFFCILLEKPKVLPYSVTLFVFPVTKLHNHIQTKKILPDEILSVVLEKSWHQTSKKPGFSDSGCATRNPDCTNEKLSVCVGGGWSWA